MQQSNPPKKSARITLRLIVLTVAIVLTGTVASVWSREHADQRLRENLIQQTEWVSQELDAGSIRAVSSLQIDTFSKEYTHLIEEMSQIKQFFPECRNIYLVRRGLKGEYRYFAVLATTDRHENFQRGDVYQLVEHFSPAVDKVSIVRLEEKNGEQVFSVIVAQPYTDEPLFLGMEYVADHRNSILRQAAFPAIALTIGTLVLLLLMTIILQRSLQYSRHVSHVGLEDKMSYYVAVTGLFLTCLVAVHSNRWETESRADAFEQLAQERISAISKGFHTLENVELEALARFFASSEYVTPDEFKDYTNYLLDNPAVQSWQWIVEINPDEIDDLEKEMRDLGYVGFRLEKDAGQGFGQVAEKHYVVVRQVSKANFPLHLGTDFATLPETRLPLEISRETGLATASYPVSIGHAPRAIYLFRPVSLRIGKDNRLGYVSATFQLSDILSSSGADDVVRLDIAMNGEGPGQIFTPSPSGVTDSFSFSVIKPVLAFGRTFTVHSSSGSAFHRHYPVQAVWITSIIGLLLTTLLTILVAVVQRRQVLLGDLVEERNRELHLERNRSEQAIQGADLGTWDLDLATHRVTLNENWARMLGLEPVTRTMTTEELRSMTPVEVHDKLAKIMEAHLRGEIPLYELEHPFIHRSGHQVWVLVRGRASKDESGQPVRVSGTYLDITQRREAETALIRSETHLRTLLDTLPDLVWLKDVNGVFISCNKKFERFIGVTEAQLVGKTDFDFFDRELAAFFRENDKAAIQAGKPTMNEETVSYADDGHTEILETIKTPLFGPDAQLLGVLGVARDISERKQAENEREKLQLQLVQAQKMEAIGRLAGGIAHDLNNLLVPMIGYSELLLDELDADEETVESLESIMNAGFRARDLVRQLLAFSRKQPLDFGHVDINMVIEQFQVLLRRTIPEDIHLEINLSPDIKPIVADSIQIEQILMNLAVNAVDAMDQRGTLTIETTMVELDEEYAASHSDVRPGEYVMLAISDDGSGIDKSTREKIFEPFFSTKGERGTGLGLATVFGIVKQHGGDIYAYSEPGEGTTFKIYLPSVAGEVRTKEALNAEIVDLRGNESILIVEDNAEVRRLVDSTLRQYGYKTITARSGENAIKVVQENSDKIELLLTDVVMPGINGRELFDQLATSIADLKVLYMSGYTDDVIVHRGILDEGIHLIQKPFSTVALATAIRRILDSDQEATTES